MIKFIREHRRLFDYLGYQAVQLATGVLAIPILTRLVDVKEYGLISLAGSISLMTYALAFQWIQFVIGRRSGGARSDMPSLDGPSLAEFAGSMLLGALFLIVVGWIGNLSWALILLLVVVTPGYSMIMYCMEYLYMKQRSSEYRRIGNGYSVLKQFLGISAVAWAAPDAVGYVSGWLIASIIVAGVAVCSIGWRELASETQSRLDDIRYRLEYGYPFALAGILEVSATFIPILLLANTGAVEDVARFTILLAITNATVYLLPSVIIFNNFPSLLTRFDNADVDQFSSGSADLLKRALGLCLALAIPFVIGGPTAVALFGGVQYQVSHLECAIAAVYFIAMVAIRAQSFHYKAYRFSRRMTWLSFLATGAMAAMAFSLVPKSGLSGALLAIAAWAGTLAILQAMDIRSWQQKPGEVSTSAGKHG